MRAQLENKVILLSGSFLLLCLLYYTFGFLLHRSQTVMLLLSYAGLWLLSWPWLNTSKSASKNPVKHWKIDLLVGLLFRVLLLFSWPNLSQDVYRFLWDGALFAQGISPYLYLPADIASLQHFSEISIPNSEQLLNAMGVLSAGNYSNYPPIKQLIFALPHFLNIQELIFQISTLRVILILGDVGVFLLGRQLLEKLSINSRYINWYFLNPFIILELTGNCHFEGLMALSIMAGLVLLIQGRFLRSGGLLGIAVGIKLIPLMLIPIIGAYIGSQFKSRQMILPLFWFGMGLIGTIGLVFLPFLNAETITHYTNTTGLWFTKFEFNASFYYLLRWLGFQWKGYNIIAQLGPALSVISTLFIFYLSYRVLIKKSALYSALMGAVIIYLLCATTVHPWYWTTVLILSILAQRRIGLLASFLVFLSYTAYGNESVQEQSLWLFIEYFILIGYLLWEIKTTHGQKPHCPDQST